MINQIFLVLFLILIPYLSGCGKSQNSNFEQYEERFKSNFKDPESVRIEHLLKGTKTNYCGIVRAKNAFGGYTGAKWFTYDTSLDRIALIDNIKSLDDYRTQLVLCEFTNSPTPERCNELLEVKKSCNLGQ